MVRTLNFPNKLQWEFIALGQSSAQWLEYIKWILSKGADLYARQDLAFVEGQYGTELLNTRQLLSANAISLLAWKIGIAMAFQEQRRHPLDRDNDPFPVWYEQWATESTQQTLRRILMDGTTDDCTCSCSASGCTARTLISKSYASEMRRLDLCELANDYGGNILRLAELTDTDVALWSSEALRWLTFQELGLKHTCCDWYCVDPHSESFVSTRIKDQTKIDELQEQNSEGISLLEWYLLAFETKIDEENIPFAEFLRYYWAPTMDSFHEDRNSSDMEASKRGLAWVRSLPDGPTVFHEFDADCKHHGHMNFRDSGSLSDALGGHPHGP